MRASCFSEMAVSKVKMMELSELRSYSFLGSMHIVFHLQFNLPSSSFLLPMSVFDATVQLNGGGRNPEPYQLADGSQSWSPRFHSFGQVSAQVTRWFRHWSIYVGGENLTGFRQKTPIYGASNPWGSDFEPTLVWGPVEGRMFYAGVRVHF